MLTSIELNNKGYDELLAEALTQIARYSGEWTNFNVSDPGITMLENFTAFNVLQEQSISTVTEPIRRRLLALVGMKAAENTPAVLLTQTPADEGGTELPAHYALSAGSLDFETAEVTSLPSWQIAAMYAVAEEKAVELTRMLQSAARAQAAVFGSEPVGGESFVVVLSGEVQAQERLLFWAQAAQDDRRNPFTGADGPQFAETRWQYYTAAGWSDCAAADDTRAFLKSGAVEITLGSEAPAVYDGMPAAGYALRCLLLSTEYDTAPRLESFSGNLFPVFQQKTRCAAFHFDAAEKLTLRSELAGRGAMFVYCREKPEADYRAYAEYAEVLPVSGRYYTKRQTDEGAEITFDSKKFGFGPAGADSVLVCCCTEEALTARELGPVYGYEEQTIALPWPEGTVAASVQVLAELPPDGEDEAPAYRLVAPDGKDEEELCYSISETDGTLLIRHPAYGDAYRLLLAACVTTNGAQGNVRAGARLTRFGGYDGTDILKTYSAPSTGFGGESGESPEELRQRFAHEMRGTHTAVTAEDYEKLVLTAPGLCIHKVKAVAVPQENLVRVVVKPQGKKPCAPLPPLYRHQLEALLDEKRMLTSRVELVEPRYVRVDVQARLTVRPHFEHAREQIETLLREKLDQVTTNVPFGSWIRFGEIYDALSALPCVVSVESLHLTPEERAEISYSSMDFRMSDRALCTPGDISVELNVFAGARR